MGKEVVMPELEVRTCELGPMVVVSALGFGTEPETEAWNLIRQFLERQGMKAESGDRRFFGFNNPNPSPGSPNYGYEQWMTVDPDVAVEAPLTRKEIPGRRYVVTRFTGLQNITDTWRAFVAWFEDSGLQPGAGCDECLEELRNPMEASPDRWEFDLYLPVASDQAP